MSSKLLIILGVVAFVAFFVIGGVIGYNIKDCPVCDCPECETCPNYYIHQPSDKIFKFAFNFDEHLDSVDLSPSILPPPGSDGICFKHGIEFNVVGGCKNGTNETE